MSGLKFVLLLMFLTKYLNACSVCVEDSLLTSYVKCPICPCSCAQSTNSGNKCFGPAQPCDKNYKYRSHDGSCNNLKNPSWGRSFSPFVRLIPPHYGDNNHSLRLSSNGKALPLARDITTNIFSNATINDDSLTLLAMQWGQIMAHDITISQPSVISNVYCCDTTVPDFNNTCLPLEMPENDFFYSKYNVKCIGEIRTLVSDLNYCCQKGPAQQINANSHIMDASLVYGSTSDVVSSLREFKGGRLIGQLSSDGRPFLPQVAPPIENNCFIKNVNESCYVGGDPRINQNTELTMLQTVFFREHNRIAKKLESMHENWTDEILYQETRAIVIAIFQHVAYNELLPLYIGEKNMLDYNLYSKRNGYSDTYDSTIKPIIINAFATSAYRFGHSAIQGTLNMCDYGRKLINSVNLTDFTDRPNLLHHRNNFDEFLVGITNQEMGKFGRGFDAEITSKLFHFFSPFGHDLLSLDIQRGRDHGLGPYVHFLEICTGYKARTFEDLELYISQPTIPVLKSYYNDLEDIDLHVGGALEKIVNNTNFGPTFLCLVTEQFYRLKHGDRFWYETKSKTHGFTKQQLQEIRKITASRLICDNSDNITTIAQNSFRFTSSNNKIKKCSDLPEINLQMWK